MTHARTHRGRLRVALTSIGGLLLAFGLYAGLVTIGAATTNTCQQEGPSSPLAVVSESSDTVKQSLSWWPLGRACEWLRADGNGTVMTYSGTAGGTAAPYGAVLLGVGVLSLGARRPAERAAEPHRFES